jgi:hypothetical protein
MRKPFAWTLTWAAVAGLLAQAPNIAIAQQAPAAAVSIETCSALNDADVRGRIQELASTNLKAELSSIDFPGLVGKYWTKADIGARLDREVDAAIESVRADSSWVDRAYSTVSTTAAGRYAAAVADKTYNSQGFKTALNELATGVAKDAGAQIEAATAKVANPIVTCVQTALQSKYGGAIAQVFAQESQKNLEARAEQPAVKIGTSDLVIGNAASISGIVLLVTRRILASLVENIGSRIAGVVASRIVSSVAGLIGLALIAKDIYEAGEGVFPIISDHMKSDGTKTLIKDEIGKSIQADISQQAGNIAQETSVRIYSVWEDFKKKYQTLLSLSEKNAEFATVLKDARLDQIGKLGQIVEILKTSESEDAVFESAKDGSLATMLQDLNDAGLAIAVDRKSIKEALQWIGIAGPDLPRIVDTGIYHWLPPEGLTHETLEKLLALNDRIALDRIASLTAEERAYILSLPGSEMRDLARRLNDRQLAAFADYERKLEPNAARLLARTVGETPGIMQELTGEGLQNAILTSRDQVAALNMVIHNDASLFSYGRIVKDAELVQKGEVGYRVFWERYWPSLALAAFLVLLLLSWLRRQFFRLSRVVTAGRRK